KHGDSCSLIPLFSSAPAGSDKPDRMRRLGGRRDQRSNRFEDLLKSVIIPGLKFIDPSGKFRVFHQCRSHLYEGAHDVNAGFDGNLAIQDARQHDGAMFVENVRWMFDVLATL